MIRILEKLYCINEISQTINPSNDKVIEKEYKDIDIELTSKLGVKLIVHGEDNHNNIANTYALKVKKITKTKTYLHEYILDSTMPEGLESWLNKLENASYINKFFKIITEMNTLGFIKHIHNENGTL